MLHQLSDDKLEAIRPDGAGSSSRSPVIPRAGSGQRGNRSCSSASRAGRRGSPASPGCPASRTAPQTSWEDFQKFVLAPIRSRRAPSAGPPLPGPEPPPAGAFPTRVYRTGELELLDDLWAHLAAQGWEGQLDLTDRNETPLRPLASMFTPEIQDKIRSVYGQDFETFGYDGILPNNLHPEGEYEPAELDEVGVSSTAPSGWAISRSGPLSSARPRKPGGRSSRSFDRNWPGFGRTSRRCSATSSGCGLRPTIARS